MTLVRRVDSRLPMITLFFIFFNFWQSQIWQIQHNCKKKAFKWKPKNHELLLGPVRHSLLIILKPICASDLPKSVSNGLQFDESEPKLILETSWRMSMLLLQKMKTWWSIPPLENYSGFQTVVLTERLSTLAMSSNGRSYRQNWLVQKGDETFYIFS